MSHAVKKRLPVVSEDYRTRQPRTQTENIGRLSRQKFRQAKTLSTELPDLPKTSAECPEQGLCTFIRCENHLAVEVSRAGNIIFHAPVNLDTDDGVPDIDLDPDREWCLLRAVVQAALSVPEDTRETGSNRGGLTLAQAGWVFGMSAQATQYIEEQALRKLRNAIKELSELQDYIGDDQDD